MRTLDVSRSRCERRTRRLLMPLDRLEKRRDTYQGIQYEVTVYYQPENAYTQGDQRLVIVEPFGYEPSIKTVRLSYPLEPTSMWPWKDPDPVSKDEHVERAVNQFAARVDESLASKEKARQ